MVNQKYHKEYEILYDLSDGYLRRIVNTLASFYQVKFKETNSINFNELLTSFENKSICSNDIVPIKKKINEVKKLNEYENLKKEIK